jgi:hypothetical protein
MFGFCWIISANRFEYRASILLDRIRAAAPKVRLRRRAAA